MYSLRVEEEPSGLKGVRLLTLSREKQRNALDVATAQAIQREVERANLDDSIHALVLTGAGNKAFCAGADLSVFGNAGPDGAIALVKAFEQMFLSIRASKTPLIAAVNGIAVGAGFGLVLASDFAVCAQHAKLGAPEMKRALFPAIISHFIYDSLPRKIGNEITLLGDLFDAQKAKAWGIVNEVVDEDACLEKALHMAARFTHYSKEVVALARQATLQQSDLPSHEAIAFLVQELAKNVKMPQTQEAIRAFFASK